MQVKVFHHREGKNIETEINEWFDKCPPMDVLFIKQSESANDLTISVWYQWYQDKIV